MQTTITTRREIDALLKPLCDTARNTPAIQEGWYSVLPLGLDCISQPRFIFMGLDAGNAGPLSLGLFDTLHGEGPEGTHSFSHLFAKPAQQHQLATGFERFAYPLVNPTGYEDHPQPCRDSKDLNREFWRTLPEVIQRRDRFDGAIALQSDDTGDGPYRFVHGVTDAAPATVVTQIEGHNLADSAKCRIGANLILDTEKRPSSNPTARSSNRPAATSASDLGLSVPPVGTR